MIHSIVEAVALHSKETPEKLCAADGRYEFTYSEFWKQIIGYARHLKELGIEKGDHVVVRNSQNTVMLITGLAVQLVGGIFVPIEKNVADQRILEIIDTVDAKLYIAAKKTEVPCAFERITQVIKCKAEEVSYEEFSYPAAEDVAEVLFTTGTTGKSKGIVILHKNVVAVAENVIDGVEMKKNNVELIPVPLSHSHGLRRYYSNMLNGSSVVIMGSVVFTAELFDAVNKYKVTALDLVPAALASIFKLSGEQLGDYKDQIDYVQLGSAPIPDQDKETLRSLLPKSRLYNFYGTTESGCSCIIDFNQYPDKKNCIGRPTVNATFAFFNDAGEKIEATKENPGLLACAGDMNMAGYYKEETLTASILHEGYIRTEDLSYRDEEGMICLLGRQGDVITTGGNKVAPGEIEDVANAFPGVDESACVPMESPILGQEPKLFVVMKEGETFNQEDIYQFLKERLENYKVPKVIVEIEALPRTYNGKILRRALMEEQ